MRVALMRYHGQGGEVPVGWVDDAAGVEAAFGAAHEALYGFKLDAAIELVTLRIEATGRMPAPLRPVLPSGSGAKAYGRQTVHFASGTSEVPLYDRATLGAGDRIDGPAIVTQLDATTLVAPGWSGEVHPSGAILLEAH
jgi:N-methylhydantoinase A